jgi:hypothetical protein
MKPAFIFLLFITLLLAPVFYAQAEQPTGTFPILGNAVGRSVMCETINDNHPVNETIIFSLTNGKAICFTYLTQVSRKTTIYHNWYKADKLSSRFPLPIEPSQGSVFSKIQLRESDKGPWRVEIMDENGNLLKVLRFSITD